MFHEVNPGRRSFLGQAAFGAGGLALAALAADPKAKAGGPAKRVIWLHMDGGISQLDTFDPKPRLSKEHGKPFPMKVEATQFDSNGPCFGSPWKFQPRGKCGMPISDLFPLLSLCADDLAVVRSMTNESAVHANANYWMHTGWGTQGRPSVGAWVNYALGSESENLPGFIVLNGGLLPIGGTDNYKPGFLPAKHSASIFGGETPSLANVHPAAPERQKRRLELIRQLDRRFSDGHERPDPVESAIRNYELAAKLQTSVPELLNLRGESWIMRKLYGLDASFEHTRTYGRQCLLARRMIERGVRFVALTFPRIDNDTRWDAHGNLKKNHTEHALCCDQPIAALLMDLKSRGLLKETLVVFTTEFGRTPFTQGSDGRDHNQFGFSVWLAGAGVKGGTVHGATDEFGYKAIEHRYLVHDLHATVLHLMGLDHEKVTYRFGGRDYRLTDVHGKVIRPILS
jgi:hypothetical protein